MSLRLYCIEKTFSATFDSYRAVFQRDREQVQTIFELLCFHPTRKKKYATSPSQLQRSQRQIPLESIPWYWQACTLSESSMSQHLLLPDSPRPYNRLAWVRGYQYVRTQGLSLTKVLTVTESPGLSHSDHLHERDSVRFCIIAQLWCYIWTKFKRGGLALRSCFPSNREHILRKETKVKRLSILFLSEKSSVDVVFGMWIPTTGTGPVCTPYLLRLCCGLCDSVYSTL